MQRYLIVFAVLFSTVTVAMMPTILRIANENCIPMLSIQDGWTEISTSKCKSGYAIVKYKPNYQR